MIVGESDCPVNNIEQYEKEFIEQTCVINLDHDNNHLCEAAVYQSTVKEVPMMFDISQSSCKKSMYKYGVLTNYF